MAENHSTNTLPRLSSVLVGAGLAMGLLVFFAVQAMPLFGWILWIIAIIAMSSGALLLYRQEFSMDPPGNDENPSIGQSSNRNFAQ